MSWAVPWRTRLSERRYRSQIALESLMGVGASWAAAADTDILGAYNTSNVGDRCFAECLRRLAAMERVRTSVQDYSRYGTYRHARRLIIGGGGVVGPQNGALLKCAKHRNAVGGAVSVLGVSSVTHAEDVPDALAEFLRRARFISVRDVASQAALASLLGREVNLQPDIAFSLLDTFPHLASSPERRAKVLGVNVAPILMSRDNGVIRPNPKPSKWFAARLPEVAAVYSRVGPAYIELVRATIVRYIAAGFRVVTVPFAVEDATFAASVLGGLEVEHSPFDARPESVYRRVAACEHFLATRFHAHVFSLLARVPLMTLPYSPKCNLLLSDLFTDEAVAFNPTTWVEDPRRCLDYLSDATRGMVLDGERWQALRRASVAQTRRGIAAVYPD